MTEPRPTLLGTTWDHPRGYSPLRAHAEDYHRRTGIRTTWEARSLQQFADQPLADLTERYDLLVLDHPFIGEAATRGLILPLDSMLGGSTLRDLADNSVGSTWESYQWEGHTYALPLDAAGQVSAWRPDVLSGMGIELPATWDEVESLAADLAAASQPAVAVPLVPIDVWCLFLTLCANADEAPLRTPRRVVSHDVGAAVISRIRRLAASSPPAARGWNPIRLLNAMSSSDVVAYCPALFGYSAYAVTGFRPHLVRFAPIPAGLCGSSGGIVGGAGLAVSSRTASPGRAMAVASELCGAAVQRGLYAANSGQPAHRAAWTDPEVNRTSNDFYVDTLPGLDSGYLRPRFPGFIAYQTVAAQLVSDAVLGGAHISNTLNDIDAGYRDVCALADINELENL